MQKDRFQSNINKNNLLLTVEGDKVSFNTLAAKLP